MESGRVTRRESTEGASRSAYLQQQHANVCNRCQALNGVGE